MSNISDKIKENQDKNGMLRRALERIIQLYTDKSHFVYELLQNAEDAEANNIRFIQYPDRLEVFHDGKPFTSENLQGLCDIGKSDKIDNLNQIGEFGVGFKSVFGICDTVRLYSNPSHFRTECKSNAIPFAIEILDFVSPKDIPEEPLPKEYTTRFVFPYSVGNSFSGFDTVEKLKKTLSNKLQNLGITTLLFMKNLESISYQIEIGDEPISGEYLLEKQTINDHCIKVSAVGMHNEKSRDGKSEEVISYLKFSRNIEKFPLRTVDIAFPIHIDENGVYQCVKAESPYVSVYFPTETESKLDFIVQGPYRTTPNRSSIPADDEDNKLLARETAILLRQSIKELKEAKKLNLSFIKALPISEDRFYASPLFLPLHKTVKDLLSSEAVIPSESGLYVFAKQAKIARQDKLVAVFSDKLLTDLIGDGNQYYWLSTDLTQTSREYKQVYEFFVSIGVRVIPPEDLRGFFARNPKFLPSQPDDWLVSLYEIFENIPAAFSKQKNEANMLTANIIKTTNGSFVAPFRKEGGNYIPNVFLPSTKIQSTDINIVNQALYEKCRNFFDNVVQIVKPNEYEFLIKDIEKRYYNGDFSPEKHIEDIGILLKYLKYEDYKDEVFRIIKEKFLLRCADGKLHNAFTNRIFLPTNQGIDIEAYYRNIVQNILIVDFEFYSSHNITEQQLLEFGVRNSLIVGETTTTGSYSYSWWETTGDFRWKLSMEALDKALLYISAHPTAKDSLLKSQAIMRVLNQNESRLSGQVKIHGGGAKDLDDEPCELIHILRGDRKFSWDGKWLFTESGELVSPKEISKHDISVSIYGKLNFDSAIFELLRFKKTEADKVDELKKTIPPEQLEAYFESVLRERYGISSADLEARYENTKDVETVDEDEILSFPQSNVKSWEALKKHVAEMLIYADPVRYEARVRSIRTSYHPREAKAYLQNMYRHEGANCFKFSCQLCHEVCSNFEVTEIFFKPETELDPMNLCLCPNCATKYRELRKSIGIDLKNKIALTKDEEIKDQDHVIVALDEAKELWFTQTHFAEIRELIKLIEQIKNSPVVNETAISADDENEKPGLSVYSGYKGKIMRRKDGFVGIVEEVILEGEKEPKLRIHITEGKRAGEDVEIQLSFVIGHPDVYEVSDK